MIAVKKLLLFVIVVGSVLLTTASAFTQNLEGLEAPPAPAPADSSVDQGPDQFGAGAKAAQPQPGQVNADAVMDRVKNSAALTPEETSRYTLGPSDVIAITIMRHPEVSGQFPINAEGKIQYNFVGDIVISGMTKDEAAKAISQRLSDYIINPEVSVKIIGYNSKVVYVVGEVYIPGKIFMRGDTITIREALMQARLPMLSGVTKKSWLITPAPDGKAMKKEVNVYALLYEGDLRENYLMKPGDVIYIPATFLTKTMRAISPITAPIGAAASAGGPFYGY
jgi:protein involved in polysaccharide export with SLBB domain